jgi:hypothetical protein
LSKEELLQSILPEVEEEIKRLAEYLTSFDQPPTVEEMEVSIRQLNQMVGSRLVEHIVALWGRGWEGTRIPCSCGQMARFHSYRRKVICTLVGTAEIERAYYYCEECGSGFCPIDEDLGVSRRAFSLAVQRGMSSLAAVEPFELVSKHLEDLAGVSVSAKEVQTVSEWWGEVVAKEESAQVEKAFAGEVEIEAEDTPDVLAVELDGKMVPMRDGTYRELKVGAICDLVPGKEERGTLKPGVMSYVASFERAGEFGRRVWLSAARRGVEEAGAVTALGDGAAWIWNQVQEHYPQAEQILDFYHASEHIWVLGGVLFGQGSDRTSRFAKYKQNQILEGQVQKTISALRKLKPEESEKRERLRLEVGYLEENKVRMNYPSYRSRGYHIGSGIVESACKRFGARLDAAGMRWTEDGAGAIAALRAVWLSNRWESHWKPARPPLRV